MVSQLRFSWVDRSRDTHISVPTDEQHTHTGVRQLSSLQLSGGIKLYPFWIKFKKISMPQNLLYYYRSIVALVCKELFKLNQYLVK